MSYKSSEYCVATFAVQVVYIWML